MRLRRSASRPQLRDLGRSARPSLRLYDLELDSTALEEEGECLGARALVGSRSGWPGPGATVQTTQGGLPQRGAWPAVRSFCREAEGSEVGVFRATQALALLAGAQKCVFTHL